MKTSVSKDKLHEQFLLLQSLDLPESVKKEQRVDRQWHLIKAYCRPCDNSQPFEELASIMLSVLTIPHRHTVMPTLKGSSQL